MDWKEILGEELAAQVEEKMGDKKLIVNDGSYIPKSKFDEVNTAKNDYKTQLEERDKQLEGLKQKAEGNDELTKQLNDLQEANKKAIDDYEEKLKKQKMDFAIENQLLKAKARNPKAAKALLDMEKVTVDGDKVYGLEEQLTELKKSDAYLFEDGKQPGSPGANPPHEPKKTVKDEYDEVRKQIQQNPSDQGLKQKLFLLKEQLKEK